MLDHTDDTANGSMIRGLLRTVAHYFERRGKPEISKELYAEADALKPKPDPGWMIIETTFQGKPAWEVRRERHHRKTKHTSDRLEITRFVPYPGEDD